MTDDDLVGPGAAPDDDLFVPVADADADTDADTDDPGPTRSARQAEARRERRRRRRRTLVLLTVLLLVPLAVLGGVAAWAWWQIDPPGDPGREVAVTVEPGWGVAEIGAELHRQGVIGSSLVFRAYVQLRDQGPFQAGDYRLREHLGARSAARLLAQGPIITYETLDVGRPGQWLTEIAQQVQDQLPGRRADEFRRVATSGAVRSKYEPDAVDTLEGLLFPAKYRVAEDDDEAAIAAEMVAAFDRTADEVGLGTADLSGLAGPDVAITPYDVVTVASLIQSEAKLDRDRPLIASVIYNRLREGRPLQIDATVLYAIGERKPSNTAADRAVESPYNTYQVTGLPPTPIASVTRASLEAALHPADTPYLFYVVGDADGGHVFAPTYEEHLRNVERARELGLLG